MRCFLNVFVCVLVACSGKSDDAIPESDGEGGSDEWEGSGDSDDGGSGDSDDGGSGDSDDGGSGDSDDGGSGDSDDGGSGDSDDGGTDDGGTDDGGTDDGGTDDGGDAGDGGPETLDIVGNYIDDMSDEHTIRESTWEMNFGGSELYTYTITQYDNASGTLVAENGSDTGEEAGFWSRFDWTFTSSGDLYACQTDAFSATEADALAVTPADASDLDGGCPGYGWLYMQPL